MYVVLYDDDSECNHQGWGVIITEIEICSRNNKLYVCCCDNVIFPEIHSRMTYARYA